MKARAYIGSILLLGVYSLTLLHNLVPHVHHNELHTAEQESEGEGHFGHQHHDQSHHQFGHDGSMVQYQHHHHHAQVEDEQHGLLHFLADLVGGFDHLNLVTNSLSQFPPVAFLQFQALGFPLPPLPPVPVQVAEVDNSHAIAWRIEPPPLRDRHGPDPLRGPPAQA